MYNAWKDLISAMSASESDSENNSWKVIHIFQEWSYVHGEAGVAQGKKNFISHISRISQKFTIIYTLKLKLLTSANLQ
jgi:hypothetical protein